MGFWKKKNDNQLLMRDGSVVDIKTTKTIKPSNTYKTSKKKKKKDKPPPPPPPNTTPDNGDNTGNGDEDKTADGIWKKGLTKLGELGETGAVGNLAGMSNGAPLGGAGNVGKGAVVEDDAIVSDYDKEYKRKKQEYGLP